MKELALKYGCNPNQSDAKVFMSSGEELPFEVLNGRPGYINLLDALNGWALVRELGVASRELGLDGAAAASFKHVSPAGAALGVALSEAEKKACFVDDIEGLDASPLACAYARARGADRMSSFGDFVALGSECDEVTAKILSREVSDGVIAPAFSEKALEILRKKRGGNYCILKINAEFEPNLSETKQVFGVSFLQNRNTVKVSEELLKNVVTAQKSYTKEAVRDLLVALITLKYTQSNSVCFAYNGGAIGVGAGQQSRVHCTRLAGNKADLWFLRQSEAVFSLKFKDGVGRAEKNNFIDCYLNDEPVEWREFLSEAPREFGREARAEFLRGVRGVSLASDAFFPFSDNIERAARSGVSFVSEPGGSVRDEDVIKAADKFGMVMSFSGVRLFHH